ncbi:hypothetical protein VTN00DRAFT_6489 [Thermoascus crustaceus]|uniref:uncharacterized protein n=1 Tax=Thermoascus crustaceus TaxID=5088 RepID=UPI00374484BA
MSSGSQTCIAGGISCSTYIVSGGTSAVPKSRTLKCGRARRSRKWLRSMESSPSRPSPSKAPNVFPRAGGRQVEHLQDDIRALSIRLMKEQIEYRESVQPLEMGFPHDFVGPDPKVTGRASGLLAGSAQIAF